MSNFYKRSEENNGAQRRGFTRSKRCDVASASHAQDVANGSEPDSTLPVSIAVDQMSDATKHGVGTVYVKPETRIRVSVSRSLLRPLRDSDNRFNPDYNSNGPDKRKKFVDFTKVDTTRITVVVTNSQNEPIPDYHFRLRALVRPESGGHITRAAAAPVAS